MYKISILTIFTFLLLGCGESGDGENTTGESRTKDVTMEINKTYTVYPGNKLIKSSALTKISIKHKDGKLGSIVRLLSGSANIIRKP
jgi:uncharacterized lipoprotein YehR (DUF1307 family)